MGIRLGSAGLLEGGSPQRRGHVPTHLCAGVRDALCFLIGQAGVQVGNACWELFGLEHGTGRWPDAK
eukprot:2524870-Lingulodinium_polyedra.AAC.1